MDRRNDIIRGAFMKYRKLSMALERGRLAVIEAFSFEMDHGEGVEKSGIVLPGSHVAGSFAPLS